MLSGQYWRLNLQISYYFIDIYFLLIKHVPNTLFKRYDCFTEQIACFVDNGTFSKSWQFYSEWHAAMQPSTEHREASLRSPPLHWDGERTDGQAHRKAWPGSSTRCAAVDARKMGWVLAEGTKGRNMWSPKAQPWLRTSGVLIAGMLAASMSVCGSNGEVFTWQGCVGVAVARGFIWAHLCVCAEPTRDDVHPLFPWHLTEIQVGPHQRHIFPALCLGVTVEKQACQG